MLRLLLLPFLIAPVLALPVVTGPIVTNAADRGSTTVAPGSFISIRLFGEVPFPSSTAPITLIGSDGTTYALAPIVPSAEVGKDRPLELWAVIPSSIKTGIALLSAQGEGTAQTPVQIIDTVPALFTNLHFRFVGGVYDVSGDSTAVALNQQATPIGMTSAAVPGRSVALFATGLNGATTNDVTVELAGLPITPLFAGAQGQPGLDQVNFVVLKDTVLGC